jgi:hypothetical protein
MSAQSWSFDGPAPEPVADVDLLDHEPGGEDQRVRHARVVVVRVGVLVDVEVLLHLEVGVGQERPARAGRDLQLEDVVQHVRHDRDELGEGDRAELVEVEQLAVVLALARAVLAAAEVQDQDVVALELGQPVQLALLVGQLEVGDRCAWLKVLAHADVLIR